MKKYEITVTKPGETVPCYSEILSGDRLFYYLPRAGCSEYTYTTANDLLDYLIHNSVANAKAEDAAQIIKTIIDDFFAAIPTEDKTTQLNDLHALQWFKETREISYTIGSDPVKVIRKYFSNLQDTEIWEIKEAKTML